MADVITRLKLESGEYDSKIKRASQEILQYAEHCKKMGYQLGFANKDAKDFASALGNMTTTSQTARGKVNELTAAFTDLKVMYNQLSQTDKNGEMGRNLARSLETLKGRINEAKGQLSEVNKEIGNTTMNADTFKSIIDGLGQKMGVGVDVTSMLTSKTALLATGIGAATTAVVAATKAWADYNTELAKQDQITTVTTGLKGEDANRMTDQMRALSQTYGVDFREAVNAANTLMAQFGKTGDEAVQLIKDGMQGMVFGDGQKLLSMIQQYAPSFRDAGISASQLVAIIHNSEGGIFTDQNMNAIVMGIKNIRLMTKATSDALAKLGIDGEEMTRKLNDGSITIFEAMRKVSQAIEKTGSGSQAAGEVMQAVFGRQGVAAGTNLGKAIATLNTNLEETKRQTGELGEAYADLQNANERLNKAIRDCFGYDGWEQMTTGIKAQLITALSATLEKCNSLYKALDRLGMVDAFSRISAAVQNLINPFQQLVTLANTLFNTLGQEIKKPVIKGVGYSDMEKSMGYIKRGGSKSVREQRYNAVHADLIEKFNNAPGGAKQTALLRRITMLEQQKASLVNPQTKVTTTSNSSNTGGGKSGGTTTVKTEEKELTIQQQIAKLEKEALTATGERREAIAENIQYLDRQLEKQKELNNELHGRKKEDKDIARYDLDYASGGNSMGALAKFTSGLQAELQSADLGSDTFATLTEQLADANTMSQVLQQAMESGVKGADFSAIAEEMKTKLLQGGISEDQWQEFVDNLNALIENSDLKLVLEVDAETGKIKDVTTDIMKQKEAWNKTGQAMGIVSQAFNAIQDPAAKIMGTVAQAIANVALAYSDAMAKDQTTKFNLFGFIAAASAATIGMISTIASIHSATGYAQGGIVDGRGGGFVGGTAYSGDNVGNVRLDSGELVLNRAQQGILASQLESANDGYRGTPQARISGEQIYLTLGAYLKRSGRGEILTSR